MSEHVKAIAIDYDGCLAINSWPGVGEPNWPVINRAKEEQAKGAKLILWTCREGDKLEEALNACWKWGLRFDSVNESLPEWIEAWGNSPRKIGATEYWDDRAVRMPPPMNASIAIYDKEEIHHDCTVQILTNSVTGEQSIGWWHNDSPPVMKP